MKEQEADKARLLSIIAQVTGVVDEFLAGMDDMCQTKEKHCELVP